jgi:hypothetical protein
LTSHLSFFTGKKGAPFSAREDFLSNPWWVGKLAVQSRQGEFMKSLLKVFLGVLFLTSAGMAVADEGRGGAVVIVAPEHHYHHRHHRHYYHHDQPRSGVSLGVGIHN